MSLLFRIKPTTYFSCKLTEYEISREFLSHMFFGLKPLQTLKGRCIDRLTEAGSLLGFLYFVEEGEGKTFTEKVNHLS